jgi:hypothetical protein
MTLIAASLSLGSCSKDDEDARPDWQAVSDSSFSISMTAVVAAPSTYMVSDEDVLGAFVNGECRGVGRLIDGLFYVNIQGSSSETGKVVFRYYNADRKSLIKDSGDVTFSVYSSLGSVDDPYVLSDH